MFQNPYLLVIAHHIADPAFWNAPLICEVKPKAYEVRSHRYLCKNSGFFNKLVFVINAEFCNKYEILLYLFLRYHSKGLRRTIVSCSFLQDFGSFFNKIQLSRSSGRMLDIRVCVSSVSSLHAVSAFHIFSLFLFLGLFCNVP